MTDVQIVKISSGATYRIGLIVRGKAGPDHHPGKMEQHADCILADGSPIGFFGEGNDNSGNAIGMRMEGIVYDHGLLARKRPYYVDMDSAVVNRVVSTVLLISVSKTEADAFAAAWSDMTLNPGDFNIFGGNCSTNASSAFIRAKMISSTIPGLDTPDNLYGQLAAEIPEGRRTSITGFIGFVKNPAGGYVMKVTPYVDSPKANRPNPGSSISSGG